MKRLLAVTTITFLMLFLVVGMNSAEEAKTADVNQNEELLLKLDPHIVNILKVGEYCLFEETVSSGTGYSWKAITDNSGVYIKVKTLKIRTLVSAGGPVTTEWQFKAIKTGNGEIKFELFGPGNKLPVKIITIKLRVEE